MKNTKGYTLLELLLYVSLTGVIILAVSTFLSILMQNRIKNEVIAEVEQQGNQILQTVTQTIRNADAVNSPAAGASANTLNLDVYTASSDPTIFDQSSGIVRIKEGVSNTVDLNNSRITVSGLTFSNVSRTGTPGSIKIQFTISYNNNSGRQEFTYSKAFYGSASLR